MKQQLQKIGLTLLFLLTVNLVSAQTFVQGGLEYTVTSGTNVSVGKDTTCPTGALVIPSTVDNASITYNVTSIASQGFRDCNSLTSVNMPESIISIGSSSFQNCTLLTSITIPNSVTSIGRNAFNSCASLTSVTIPDGVTIIDDYTFLNCTSLTSITIPDSLTTISIGAFQGCTSLTSITIPDGVTIIGVYAFSGCTSLTSITIPNGVTYFGRDLFSGCTSLIAVTMPDGATSLGINTFSGCTSLTSFTIPESVTTIGDGVFSGCTSLTAITIPNSVTTIEKNAFSSCNSFTSVTIPNSVTTIGNGAFESCEALTDVNVGWATPLSIDADVFENVTLSNVTLNTPAPYATAYQSAAVWEDFGAMGTFVPTLNATINQCSPYTTPGGYTFTASGTYTETTDTAITNYTVTIGSYTAITQDLITDETVCDDSAIAYEAEIHTTSYLEFDKTEGRYVNVDTVKDELAANDRSIFMWVKAPTNVISTTQMLFAVNSSGGGNICNLQIATDEKLEIFDGSSSRTSTATLNDGLWHYVGYTYNNATNQTIAYVDGVNVLSYTNGQDATATSVYSLGQEYDSGLSTGNFYDGLIAETSIWNKVLDATDITTAMASKITDSHPSYANLVGYYSFAECGQDTAVLKDWSGKNNDGIITGTVLNTANYDEISGFEAEAWYTKSWQKNDVQFDTASTVNIAPSAGTDTYKLLYSRDYISSTDTWNITNNQVPFTTQPTDITVAPNTNATFTSDGGSGVTYQWYQQIEESITNKTISDGLGSNICYDVYESNGTVYAATSEGLSISTDGGATFTTKTTDDGLGHNNSFGVYKSNTTLYVGTQSGLAISTDGGTTFTNKTTEDGLGANRCNSIYESNNKIYVATDGGLSISTDEGATFINKSTDVGLPGFPIRSVYESNNILYVTSEGGGLSISIDGGNTFTNRTSTHGLPDISCYGVYKSNSALYVTTSEGLAISIDDGNTFTSKYSSDGLGESFCYDVYESNGTLYVATNGGLSISTDGGNTFTNKTTDDGLAGNSCNSLYESNNKLNIGTFSGLSILTSNIFLNGETNQNLTLSNVQLTDNGNQYFVEGTKSGCTTKSTTATLTVSAIVTTNWTGASADWNTASNWAGNTLPTATDDVVIPNIGMQPIIDASTTALTKNLTIEASAGLIVASGGALTVSGNFNSADANALVVNSGSSVIVNGTATGNVLYKRNLPTNNWYSITSPVNGESVKDFLTAHTFSNGSGTSPNRNVSFAKYNNDGSNWNYYTDGSFDDLNGDDTTDMMNIGEGFSVKLAAAGDISFSGTINTVSLNSKTITQATNNFNLVGNPFMAYLNLGDFFGDNVAPSVLSQSTAWFWNYSTDNYETKTAMVDGDFEIAPAQGFFVSAGVASVNTTFDVNDLTHQSNDAFQKSADTRPQIKLFMTDGKNTRYSRIFFIEGTTTGFDNGYDGTLFGGTTQSFAVYTNLVAESQGQKLAVQVLPPNEFENTIIPIGVNATSGTEIKFTTASLNLPSSVTVYIEDKQTNTFTRIDEENSKYTITLTQDLNDIGRFYLHTSSPPTSVNDINLENISMYKLDKSTLRIVGLQNGKTDVKIFNVLGKQVLKTSFTASGTQDISLQKLSSGVYVIQLKTSEGNLNKKIILE